ncbi:MAG: hypothetical protein CYPHOPRED_005157 [Cyphobasidiales sp. Tagirdzhanova-0007]|nr:MAG: hypothetical protein CYPHOPRED_005157 [Cyphobasidiales sp. Tagirdzhanova-0007]
MAAPSVEARVTPLPQTPSIQTQVDAIDANHASHAIQLDAAEQSTAAALAIETIPAATTTTTQDRDTPIQDDQNTLNPIKPTDDNRSPSKKGGFLAGLLNRSPSPKPDTALPKEEEMPPVAPTETRSAFSEAVAADPGPIISSDPAVVPGPVLENENENEPEAKPVESKPSEIKPSTSSGPKKEGGLLGRIKNMLIPADTKKPKEKKDKTAAKGEKTEPEAPRLPMNDEAATATAMEAATIPTVEAPEQPTAAVPVLPEPSSDSKQDAPVIVAVEPVPAAPTHPVIQTSEPVQLPEVAEAKVEDIPPSTLAPAAVVEPIRTEEAAKEGKKDDKTKDVKEEKKDDKPKDPKKQAKLARRLSAKVMGIISPRSEKSKKEAELVAPEEMAEPSKTEESAPTVNTEIPGGDLSSSVPEQPPTQTDEPEPAPHTALITDTKAEADNSSAPAIATPPVVAATA